MKTLIATVLALSCTTASAWQQFNATTIGPNGPTFTFGQVYGGSRVQQFNTTTIRPGGGVEFGYGNVNRYRNVDQFNYYQYGAGQQPRATFGNVYRQMLLDDE